MELSSYCISNKLTRFPLEATERRPINTRTLVPVLKASQPLAELWVSVAPSRGNIKKEHLKKPQFRANTPCLQRGHFNVFVGGIKCSNIQIISYLYPEIIPSVVITVFFLNKAPKIGTTVFIVFVTAISMQFGPTTPVPQAFTKCCCSARYFKV